MITVIEKAEPILSWKLVKGGYGRYVKHWDVEGYTWDGDCMCTKESFKKIAQIQSLEVSELDLINSIVWE
jgi:hypothetical protein